MNDFFIQPVNRKSLLISVMIGAAIGLIVISAFVFHVNRPHPEWGEYWRLRPLMVTPLAGALGGLCFYFMTLIHFPKNWLRIVAMVLSVIGFIIAIWMGIVLGLVGTLWH